MPPIVAMNMLNSVEFLETVSKLLALIVEYTYTYCTLINFYIVRTNHFYGLRCNFHHKFSRKVILRTKLLHFLTEFVGRLP
jgi:hypothetical protein